ncbi:MAG: redoxin domain-containing protein [Bacteroidetes bacterium]|nr:redoxin domain-containing protein [Bacteroidota bacterium]
MKKYGFIIALAILAIPALWLFLLKDGEIVSSPLAIYGERYYDNKIGDTVYHTISDFSFIDQEGDSFSKSDLQGKIYVANFFFTHCPDICPTMMSNLQFVYNKYKESPDIRFVSMTVDPKRDSVPELAKYGYDLGANPKRWYLATGSKQMLYSAAEYDYLLASVETPLETAFIHSDMAVLIDKDFRIRGFYKATDFNEMRRLSDDIKALVVEYHARN